MMFPSGLSAFCALLILVVASSAASAAEQTLRDDKLVRTPEGREQLKYLINCALVPDDTVIAQADEQRYVFHGGMGLAPRWTMQALTASEQRLVSACIFARSNYFGVPVQISMRSDAGEAPRSLRADADERHEYPFLEGGFFGNIFLESPEAYVCTGDNDGDRSLHLRSLLRVCSLPLQGNANPSISRCGFVITGPCKAGSFLQNGVDYSAEVLKVFLPGRRNTR